jgi:outer membrane protein assembly factor BamB
MESILKRRQARIRRRRRAIRIAIALVSLFVTAGIVLPILYNYTDLINRPLETINSNSLPNDWAMFRHDLSNSGTTGATDISPQPKIKWTFATGGIIHSSAAVANGTVYFGSRYGGLYAVDAATGNKQWEFPIGSGVQSTPAIVNGIVYFGSNDGAMYAVDVETGQMVWKFPTSYPIISSPAVADSMVFFGCKDYSVYALDALTGTLLWRVETAGRVTSSPAVSEGLVFVGSGSCWFR